VPSNLLFLGLGLGCAAIGGELFVRGLLGIAWWLRIPAGVIGLTIAAFATSSPELTVAINAAGADRPEIALGDALGSNIVNVGLVVGVIILVGASVRDLSRPDAFAALGMFGLLGVLVVDGDVSRLDGAVLLAVFVFWLTSTLSAAHGERGEDSEATRSFDVADTLGEHRHGRSVVEAFLGLVFLIAAGRLLVVGAKGLGEDLGLSTFVVGAVLVSLGTSMPELATALSARLRGHTELGLGTVLGSNIFNTTCIVGLAAVISPIGADRRDVWISLAVGAAMLLLLLWRAQGTALSRWRGAALVSGYVATLGVLVFLQA
jgi:cation:H+ antiporter